MYHIAIGGSTDLPRFDAMVRARQENEIQMSLAVEQAFDESKYLLTYLKEFVRLGLGDTIDLVRHGALACFLEGHNDVGAYTYWDDVARGKEIKNCPTLFYRHVKQLVGDENALRRLKARDCSSFIRFYGECVEAIKKHPTLGFSAAGSYRPGELPAGIGKTARQITEAEQQRVSYQASTQHALFSKGLAPGDQRRRIKSKTMQEFIEALSDESQTPPAYRELGALIGRSSPAALERGVDHWLSAHEAARVELKEHVLEWILPWPHTTGQRLEAEKIWQHVFVDALRSHTRHARVDTKLRQHVGGGIQRWTQLDSDALAKFNKLFGLRHGATVSGTATDTLFFLDTVADANKNRAVTPGQVEPQFSPMFYLLVIAGIVAAGHHTTNEVAIPLAINKADFQYSIGCYSTLYPAGRETGGASVMEHDKSQLMSVLQRHEDSTRNPWVVVYYHPSGKPDGFLYFEKGKDTSLWKELTAITTADQGLIGEVQKLSAYPTKQELMAWPRFSTFIKVAPRDMNWFQSHVGL